MCVLALAWQAHPRWRLVLAGNRDEFHARPTAPLARWPEAPGLLAGRDLQAGGTWVGIDDLGRMAVVTNVRDPAQAGTRASSRGTLVSGFLRRRLPAAAMAAELLDEAAGYAPFNLLLADAADCVFIGNHPHPRHQALPPGIHGLSNGNDLHAPWPKTARLVRAMQGWIADGGEDPDALWPALSDERRAEDAALPATGIGLARERLLSPVFIRDASYGTRASTLIAIDHGGRGWIRERRFGPGGAFLGETTLATAPH